MPYKTLEALPKQVKENLPKHAQEIYRATYNNAWEHYETPDMRAHGATREETAHRVAWSAVKEKYEKKKDTWVEKKNA